MQRLAKPLMGRCRPLLAATLAAMLLTSCEVEFSPNAAWKDIPVVYCLLDQDDDTTWVRVERCYLGDGDIRSHAAESDSIHYPAGTLQVSLLAYRGDDIVDSLPFQEVSTDRADGHFAHTAVPSFYSPTRGRLDESNTYRLRVRRKADGALLAQNGVPVALIAKNPTDSLFRKPYSGRRFAFKDGNNNCEIEWNPLTNARLYQPIVRLYYEEGGDTTSIDINCQQVTSRNAAFSYSIFFAKSSFLTSVKEQLASDTVQKRYLSMVDIYLVACSEEMKAYLYSIGRNGGNGQTVGTYTNIDGGLGIVATRRTHLFKHMPADDSMLPGGLLYDLKELGVGF